jgi:hypothetical protein
MEIELYTMGPGSAGANTYYRDYPSDNKGVEVALGSTNVKGIKERSSMAVVYLRGSNIRISGINDFFDEIYPLVNPEGDDLVVVSKETSKAIQKISMKYILQYLSTHPARFERLLKMSYDNGKRHGKNEIREGFNKLMID